LREAMREGARELSGYWGWFLVLGVWAVRSWERSLLTLLTLVGVWAIVVGVNEIFAAFTLREAGKQVKRLAD
jgi:uncharacterized membrane protein HdeD (DUF308 family)